MKIKFLASCKGNSTRDDNCGKGRVMRPLHKRNLKLIQTAGDKNERESFLRK